MFHARIITPGKLKSGALYELQEDYIKRMKPRPTLLEINTKKLGFQKANLQICQNISSDSSVILLDERGKNLNSREFAALIEHYAQASGPKIDFVIGPSDGFTPESKKLADEFVSLGSMTWPHLLTRILLLEQLYRAQMIISGHPYHKD